MTLPGSYQSGDGWKPEADDCYKVESAARDFKYTGTHYFPADRIPSSMILVRGLHCWRYYLNEGWSIGPFVIGDGGNVRLRLPVIIE